MVRAPFWTLESESHIPAFQSFIQDTIGITEIRNIISQYSSHANLIDLQFYPVGSTLHVRFVYETGDAAGQNMTTTTTWEVCRVILKRVAKEAPSIIINQFVIEGHLASDKTASALNVREGRGIKATATAFVPTPVIKRVLKADPHLIVNGLQKAKDVKDILGALGTSLNCANVIGAMFAACGQDIASVYESAVGHFDADWVPPTPEHPEGGIQYTMTLHNLVIGTVGGGTGLATQKECLAMMGCYGSGKARRLAEIICGFAMALDMSTSAAIGSQQFAKAHEALGRNKPDFGFQKKQLDDKFFGEVVKGYVKTEVLEAMDMEGSVGERKDESTAVVVEKQLEGLKVISGQPSKLDSSESILSDMSSNLNSGKLVGLFGCDITYDSPAASLKNASPETTLRAVIKSKATDKELINSMNKLAIAAGPPVSTLFEESKSLTGFKNAHIRECALFQGPMKPGTVASSVAPKVYHVLNDKSKDTHVLVMERLEENRNVILLDKATEGPEAWTIDKIHIALRDIAAFHALHLHQGSSDIPESLKEVLPFLEITTPERAETLTPLFASLLTHNQTEFPLLFTSQRASLISSAIHHMPNITQTLTHPETWRTLIHNDFSPRNTCLRLIPPNNQPLHPSIVQNQLTQSEKQLRLVAYDWELSTLSVPQRDIAEFLAFTIAPDAPLSTWMHFIHHHRHFVDLAAFGRMSSHMMGTQGILVSQSMDPKEWIHIFDLAMLEFLATRCMMYGLGHTFKSYGFYERVIKSACGYLEMRLAVSPKLREVLGWKGKSGPVGSEVVRARL
jgi:hypothetical protein